MFLFCNCNALFSFYAVLSSGRSTVSYWQRNAAGGIRTSHLQLVEKCRETFEPKIITVLVFSSVPFRESVLLFQFLFAQFEEKWPNYCRWLRLEPQTSGEWCQRSYTTERKNNLSKLKTFLVFKVWLQQLMIKRDKKWLNARPPGPK